MNSIYSKCRSCGNVTFTRNARCVICGNVKPDEVGPDTPRVFDQRFMTRKQYRWRRAILLTIVMTAGAIGALYLILLLKVPR